MRLHIGRAELALALVAGAVALIALPAIALAHDGEAAADLAGAAAAAGAAAIAGAAAGRLRRGRMPAPPPNLWKSSGSDDDEYRGDVADDAPVDDPDLAPER